MTRLDDLTIEIFEGQEYRFPIEIGCGISSIVYAISDEFVIKIPRVSLSYVIPKVDDFFLGQIVEELEAEFEIQRQLYEGGVSVPKPEGIFLCDFYFLLQRWYAGLVMERIEGINGNIAIQIDQFGSFCDMRRAEIKLRGMMRIELEKVRSLGFYPCDQGLHNTIYNPEMDKLWLIDFEVWKKA